MMPPSSWSISRVAGGPGGGWPGCLGLAGRPCFDQRDDFLRRRSRHRNRQRVHRLRLDRTQQRQVQQRLLAVHVGVQRAVAKPQGSRNIRDPGRPEPLVGKHPHRRVSHLGQRSNRFASTHVLSIEY